MQFRRLGLVDFPPTFEAMKVFTAARTGATDDEIWLLQHPPVYTQGLSGQAEHVLDAGAIPVVHIDRGGQVTYHGPGQLIAYVLYDLRRAGMNVRELVECLERAVINVLADHGITAHGDPAARGVYVRGKKIAALGLKISRGRSYHGLSLNVDMDLSPFAGINPCGHEGLEVTSVQLELGADERIDFSDIGERLLHHLEQVLPSQT
ncbi:MAG: lipoyl(octanoyl) transferase LipB [Luminiphilus sp.]|nr:lipoyl(octanoyl) transferase LipB [Luminiphilus sp.]MDG1683148.1 lipoyl(octanoyl) transferase LipB [Luminiphilus sp.]MDG2136309.1 lipoyl(octanoyl) transferase LipB [Luminiphilus sp.]